jgi:nucleoside 2-deoxyribosyltransferase
MAIRIYLAGPDVFFPEPLEIAREHRDVLAGFGLEGVFPLDNEVEAGGAPREMAQRIFELNCRLIDSCQGVLANMIPFRGPSMDVGTAWEVGYAYAQGKPIVGYTIDRSDYREKVYEAGWSNEIESERDKLDHAIEHFEVTDNLMITQSVVDVVATIEEAAKLLARRLGAS